MVMKYVILSDSDNIEPFTIPRQLLEVKGEPLVKRTVRLLKENGVKDILITSHDKRFDNLGATRYEPKQNDYDGKTRKGYWLNAFPIELMNEPITFLLGDVYFSEDAIKTIVGTETDSTLFFCTYQNKSKDYIKHHDEPLAYKVVDFELFKKHIEIVKRLYDEGKTVRHPIVWELYRSINNQDVNEHKMTTNYVAINDVTCDIDAVGDITKLLIKIGGFKMVKVIVLREFTLGKFNELKNLVRHNPDKNEDGRLYEQDEFECDKEMAEYLTGNNAYKQEFVKIIEIIPEEVKEEKPVKIKSKKTKSKK